MTVINIKIVAILAGLLVIGGGAYILSERAGTTGENNQENVQTDGKTSLRTLASSGQNQKCTYSTTSGGHTSEGVMYIAGGKIRGDFKTLGTPAGDVESHMIIRDDTNYIWSSEASQGIKMSISANAQATADASTKTAVDYDSNVDYDCDSWLPDNSVFELPTAVTLMDMSTMTNPTGTTPVQGSVEGNSDAGAVQGSAGVSADVKAEQCAACDSIPGAGKAQCRQALQCK